MNPTRDLDPRAVRRAFDDAAQHYDAHAALQREVADRLLGRLDYTKIAPSRVLDLGAGTGYCTGQLERRYPKARIILADVAPAMLATARDGALFRGAATSVAMPARCRWPKRAST
jgi:malonyl-CoA O-methyltransferase